MIFGLIITGVMITFVQVVPYIEQAQSEEAIATVRNSFLELDTTIKTLLSETGTPGGFRTILLSKSAGSIEYIPDAYHISFRLIDQNGAPVHTIMPIQEIGILDWEYNSRRSILPRGTSKYLTGPDPFKTREPVFLTGVFASTEYQDLTNLTLSHRDDRKHHVTLNYRISAYLTISTQPEPAIEFQIFLVSLSAEQAFTIHSQYKQITVSTNVISTRKVLDRNESIGALELVWDNVQESGIITTSLWSTRVIQGFDVKYFNISVQTFVYNIGLST